MKRLAIALFVLIVLAGLVLVQSFQSRPTASDCYLVERLGYTLWNSNLDGVVADGVSVDDLREKADDCGFPRSTWNTPTPIPTPTYSPDCTNEAIMYIQSGGESERAAQAIERIRGCMLAQTPTAP